MGLLPVFALIGAMLLWSSGFIALKYLLDYFQPSQILFFRMLIATIVLLLINKGRFQFSYRKGDWRWLLLMGVAEPCLYFLFETRALQLTSAGQAGVINATFPLLASVGAFLFLKEKLSRNAVAGFVIAIMGCSLLSMSATVTESASDPMFGNFLEFVAMICGSVYTLSIRHFSSRYSASTLTAFQTIIGTFFFAPMAFSSPLPTTAGIGQWGCLIFLGICVSVGAYWLYTWAMARASVAMVSAYINLIPVFTLMLAFMILGESLNVQQCMACFIVFAGVVISQYQGSLRWRGPLRRRHA